MFHFIEHYVNGEKVYYKAVEPVFQKYGLTYTEFTVLLFLFNNPKYDTATEIVKFRHLCKSHVSLSVSSLVEKGLLQKSYGEKDRKTVHLRLTEKAVPIAHRGKEAQDAFTLLLTAGFTEEEKATLDRLVTRIDENIKEHLE